MEEFFVDTTFLGARFNSQDENHADATSFLAPGAFRLVTTDYVFDEMVTAILARTRSHRRAADAGRTILDSKVWRLEVLGRGDFDRAWALFLDREDKRWSFTDCTSFAFMDHRGFERRSPSTGTSRRRASRRCPERPSAATFLRRPRMVGAAALVV